VPFDACAVKFEPRGPQAGPCTAVPCLPRMWLVAVPGGEQQPGSSSAEQQLLGRRLLQALVAVWGDKSKNSSGTRMCFYAQVSSAAAAIAAAVSFAKLHLTVRWGIS